MSGPLSNAEQTKRAVLKYARLTLPGCVVGVVAAVGIAIWGTGPLGAPLMVALIGILAFAIFYLQARRAGRK